MEMYKDLGRDSGVHSFKVEADSIRVKFKDGKGYIYSYGATGRMHVEQMKLLAYQGRGLNSYINKNVRKAYQGRF